MKKKLSLLLAAAVMLEMTASVQAQSAEVTDFYADIYGVTVDFDTAVDSAAVDGYTLVCDGEPVRAAAGADGRRLTFIPEERLEADKKYSVVMNDEIIKSFEIKTLFFENFDNRTGAVEGTVTESNDYGQYLIVPGAGEAFYQNGELALANALFSISAADLEADSKKITYSMDIKGYGKKYTETSKANAGLVQILMGMRSTDADSNADGYALRLTNAKGYLGTVNSESKFTAAASEFYDENNTKYGFSVVTNDSVVIGGEYTYETESAQKEVSLRAYNNEITAYTDGKPLVSVTDDTYEDGFLNISADLRTLAVIDNVLVTCCVERLEAQELDGDFDALKLSFDRPLEGGVDFSKIKVYENDTLVGADFAVNSKDNRIINILPENYKASITYRVTVDEGFGDKRAITFEDYSFSKYIEPQEIKVVGADVDIINNIVIDFDTKVESIVDFNAVKVYENDILINADKQAAGNRLTIKPENYVIGNTYKAVAEAGIVNANFYIFDGFTVEKVLAKRELKVDSVKATTSEMTVTFTEDIPEASFNDFVKITVNDTKVPVKACSAVGKRLTLTIDGGFDSSTEYELYIKKGMESDSISMQSSYLCKIKNGTVVEQKEIGISSFKADNCSGEAVLTGSFKIKNYFDTNKPVSAAVAAYGENNLMQTAYVFDISEIEAGEILDVNFTLDKLSGAKKIGLFLWDSLENMNFRSFEAVDLAD